MMNASIKKMDKPLRLKCVSKNHKALNFYENNGWKKIIEEGELESRYWVMEYS
ncbi:acetyltransferase (putative) [Shouchella clausii]|nr:acetyltransferase (putative) [Shouchella clausii]